MKAFLRKYYLPIILVLIWLFAVGSLLAPKAEAGPNVNGPKWLLIGDSVSGVVWEPNIIPHANMIYPSLVQEGRVTLHNLNVGASGYVYNQAASELAVQSAKAYGAIGAVLALGTNDFGTGQNIAAVQARAAYYVSLLKQQGIPRVVCLTPLPRYDWRVRRGPNPGQVSALGHPLIPDLSAPARMTYSSAIAVGCMSAGAAVIYGYAAPVAIGPVHFTALTGTTLWIFLSQAGHAAVAPWLTQQMQARGFWQ